MVLLISVCAATTKHKCTQATKLSGSLDLSRSPESAEWIQLVLSLVSHKTLTFGQHCGMTSSYFDVGPKTVSATSVSPLDCVVHKEEN